MKLIRLLLFLILLAGCGSKGEDAHEEAPPPPEKTWAELTESVTAKLDVGHLDEAAEAAEEALVVAKEKNDVVQVVTSLHNLGKLRLSQGRVVESIELFEAAIEQGEHQEKPDERLVVLCLNKLAAAHYAQERPAEAKIFLEQALHKIGPEDNLRMEVLQNLARVCQQQGQTKEANEYLEMARLLRVSSGGGGTGEGMAGVWNARLWPERWYRLPGMLFAQRKIAVNRSSASSRFVHRGYPQKAADEASADPEKASGH